MNTANPAPSIAPSRDLWAAPRAWAGALLRRVVAPGRGAHPVASTVSLMRGTTTWVDEPLGRRVSCVSGTLWLCFDGEPLDIVLEPGQSHRCDGRSALSIHALSSGLVRLS